MARTDATLGSEPRGSDGPGLSCRARCQRFLRSRLPWWVGCGYIRVALHLNLAASGLSRRVPSRVISVVHNNDEASVAARLRSPTHAALVNVIGVIAPTIGADAGAIRLYRGAPQAETDEAYVLPPAGLRPTSALEARTWPMQPRSLFGQLHRRGREDGTFRVGERLGNAPAAMEELLGPMGRAQPVSDAVAVVFGVREPTWCVAMFVRCGRHESFDAAALALLDRLRPTLAWVVLMGVQRATHVGIPAGTADESPRPRSTGALDRLSDTERKVLDLLLEGLTEREAAQRIGRSPHTVHVHVKNVYRKLDVTSRRQLRALVGQTKRA